MLYISIKIWSHFKMEKSSQNIVLCFVLILASATIGGCFPSNKEVTNQTIPWPLQNHPADGEQVSPQAVTHYIHHFAVQLWDRKLDGNNYYGLEVTMDVYGFYLEREQHSSAAIWIYDKDGGKSPVNGFILGWHVNPTLYKDSDTHFVTSWTGNGSPPEGCYNRECPGYVRIGPGISPGDVISPVSDFMGKRQYITIRASKDKSSGDWQVYYGFNGPAKLVGYFPKSLFPRLEKNQFGIAFGGFTSHMDTQEGPPMGSGFFPGRSAASFYDIKFVDAEGSTHSVDKVLPIKESSPTCYRISTIASGGFSYGGPGCLKSKMNTVL
uniref:Uncharacterized protein n=1 Tax=Avena sativa TaxID=4498 RepID=A0ACD5TWQ7_AVESA